MPDAEKRSRSVEDIVVNQLQETGGRNPSLLTIDKTPASHRGSRLDLSRLQFELPKFTGAAKTPATTTTSARSEALKRAKARERKAARTLAIITGSFIVCWLPFFIVALLQPFCTETCYFHPLLVSIIGWLGYFNSLLNPIIYTVFNPDFRTAFRKILFGKYRRHDQHEHP